MLGSQLSDVNSTPSTTMRSLDQCPALVLNADYRPLSYYPLSLWSWQEAVKAIFRETVTVLSEYDRMIRSPSHEFKLPSVLVLNEYIKPKTSPAFTRFNVFLRDNWECQYCVKKFKTQALTFDHVIPRSKGGHTSWENIVTACQKCNTRKGNMLPKECDMHPQVKPYEPSMYELQEHGKKFPPHFLHKSWEDYLYWDSELEDQYIH